MDAIIRPPRAEYKVEDLGETPLKLKNGIKVERRDFMLLNREGQLLRCSEWREVRLGELAGTRSPGGRLRDEFLDPRPTIVYLHCNSSCRADVVRTGVLEAAAGAGCALVALDFSGSGWSDGEYVTLGLREQYDVEAVAVHLKARGCERFALWGRSMGATSALLYAARFGASAGLSALILDCPFSTFGQLVEDLVGQGAVRVPRFAVRSLLSFVKASVKKRAGAELDALDLVKAAGSVHIPALYVAAGSDEMTPKASHSDRLLAVHAGRKTQAVFDGGHNSARPPWVYEAVRLFVSAAVVGHNGDVVSSEAAQEVAMAAVEDLCASVQPTAPLPPGWELLYDEASGDPYFWDRISNATTWHRPFEPAPSYLAAEKRELAREASARRVEDRARAYSPAEAGDDDEDSDSDDALRRAAGIAVAAGRRAGVGGPPALSGAPATGARRPEARSPAAAYDSSADGDSSDGDGPPVMISMPPPGATVIGAPPGAG